MADLIDESIGDRLDSFKVLARRTLRALMNEPDVDEENANAEAAQFERVNDLRGNLENTYASILADAGGQEALDSDPVLRQKRINARDLLRQSRQLLDARWNYHYSNANLAEENGVEANDYNSDANTIMGGEETRRRRRRSRKQLGGRRRSRRIPKKHSKRTRRRAGRR
jgi:hypothetical protein